MPIEVKMPQLGESVTEGTVGKWLKQPGEQVERYEALLEVITDKVDTEVPAPEAGTLQQILVPEGETVRVGTVLALLGEEAVVGSQSSVVGSQSSVVGSQSSAAATQHSALSTQHSALSTQHSALSTQHSALSTPPLSPVVARLLAEHGLDAAQLSGSGLGGRVTKQDVLRYVEQRGQGGQGSGFRVQGSGNDTLNPEPRTPNPEPRTPNPDTELLPLTPMRRAIAEHMERSVRTAPHVTTVMEVDVERIAALRERQGEEFARQGVRLTYSAFFAQAIVAALQAVPVVNGSFSAEGIVLHQRIHLGVAVALPAPAGQPHEGGLLVPVIRDADEKNLLGLARAIGDLAERARTRRLRPEETQGGTFTLTNHGVSGSLFATPIINQPQAAILGIGAIQKRAVVLSHNGSDSIAIRLMCYCSLTFDHRMLDGATADAFLMAFKRAIEG